MPCSKNTKASRVDFRAGMSRISRRKQVRPSCLEKHASRWNYIKSSTLQWEPLLLMSGMAPWPGVSKKCFEQTVKLHPKRDGRHQYPALCDKPSQLPFSSCSVQGSLYLPLQEGSVNTRLTTCRAAYRRMLLTAHPDKSGSVEAFERVQQAYHLFTASYCSVSNGSTSHEHST